AVLHADPGIVEEVGHAARWIDAIVRAVRRARLGLDDLDPVLEALLDHHDAGEPGVRRRVGDVKLHDAGFPAGADGYFMLLVPTMSKIDKISVTVTREQHEKIRAAVERGDYASTSEVIRTALREWELKEELRRIEGERIARLWDEGIASGPA